MSDATQLERSMWKMVIARIVLPAAIALGCMQAVSAKGYTGPGPLPGLESKLQVCRDQVREQGHGSIESTRTLEYHGVRYHVLVTRDRDGHPRLVACAAADGRIVQAIALDRI
jgi:hypothetical protein